MKGCLPAVKRKGVKNMKRIMDATQMKQIDEYSIEKAGIPSMVLMERAALNVTQTVAGRLKEGDKVLCICGSGNNGADGMAVARQLTELGILAEVYPVFEEGKGTAELKAQLGILKALGIRCVNQPKISEYNCIVDAIFGIGLSREITGNYKNTIEMINLGKAAEALVVAVDIPSGINAADGQVMGCAVRADITVTFGYAKRGLCLYPGRLYAGELVVGNAGFAELRFLPELQKNAAFVLEDGDIREYFNRPAEANKGTFGKLLLVAGSENMAGAAALSAKAAYRTGCGLVKVFTHENNRAVVLSHVPEAVLVTYGSAGEAKEKLIKELDWADCVVAGPGISQSETAKALITGIAAYQVPEGKELPVIFDADALNIIAAQKDVILQHISRRIQCIYTPHMGEMARLSGMEIAQIKRDSCGVASKMARKLHGICVLKDAATVVSDGERICINMSGSSGMATAGSGDVLTGIMAGVLLEKAEDKSLYEKVCMGVYLHGRAGDYAAFDKGNISMKAMDIADNAAQVLKNI